MPDPVPPFAPGDTVPPAGVRESAQALRDSLVAIVEGLVEGARADIQALVREVELELVLLMLADEETRERGLRELEHQLVALVELHRLRVVGARREIVARTLIGAVRLALTLARTVV